MIALVFSYEVREPGGFERAYGADGEWTSMNRHARSYLGSSFLRDQNDSTRYMVIEYWSEMLVYEEHKTYNRRRMEDLDAHRDELVASVDPLGVFTALNVPDRWGPTWSRRS